MNRPRAEELLGGYATGSLSEAERRALFEAALEHQELFDALVDEEALRELLADPAARQRLLAVLPRPAPRPLWRRPTFIGLAASLFLLATTGLVVWRLPGGRVPLASTPPDAVGSDKAAEVPAAQAGAPVEKPAEKKEAARRPVGAVRPRPQPVEEPSKAAPADEAPELASRSKSVPMEEEVMEPPAAMASKAGPGRIAPGHTLEQLEDGRYRLTVRWDRGHSYVLKRTASGVSVLLPTTSGQEPGGEHLATFLFPAEASDRIDLYVLPEAAPDPASLPEDGPVQGRRERVHPR